MGHTHGDTQENYFTFLSMTIKKKFECFFSPQKSRVRYRFGFVFLSLQYRYPDSMINEKFIYNNYSRFEIITANNAKKSQNLTFYDVQECWLYWAAQVPLLGRGEEGAGLHRPHGGPGQCARQVRRCTPRMRTQPHRYR